MAESCSTHRAAAGALSCSRSFAITAKNPKPPLLTTHAATGAGGERGSRRVPCQRLVQPRGAAHGCSRRRGPELSTALAPQPKEEPGLLSLGWARCEDWRRGRDSAAAESEGCWCRERRPPPSLQHEARSSTLVLEAGAAPTCTVPPSPAAAPGEHPAPPSRGLTGLLDPTPVLGTAPQRLGWLPPARG